MTGPASEALELQSKLYDFDRQSRLWVLSTGGNLRCLDLSRGTMAKRHTLIDVDGVERMAVSPQGDKLLLVDRGGCRVLEEPLASGPSLRTPFEGMVEGRFTPDGQHVLLAHSSEGLLMVGVEGQELKWAWTYDRAVLEPRLYMDARGTLAGLLCGEDVVLFTLTTGDVDAEMGLAERTIEAASPNAALTRWALAVDGGKCLYMVERMKGDRFRYDELELESVRVRTLARSTSGGLVLAERSAKGALWLSLIHI